MSTKKKLSGPPLEMCGELYHLTEKGEFKKRFSVLNGNKLLFYANVKESEAKGVIILDNCDVRPMEEEYLGRSFCFEIMHPQGRRTVIAVNDAQSQSDWMAFLLYSAEMFTWPGGLDSIGRVKPVRYVQGETEELLGLPASCHLPRYYDVPVYQRRVLLLRKMFVCTVNFKFETPEPSDLENSQELPDPTANVREANVSEVNVSEEEMMMRELKQATLTELIELWRELVDPRLFMDALLMCGTCLFRCLPQPPDDQWDDEDDVFTEPAWDHLALVYDLLFNLVKSDVIDTRAKKRCLDTHFITSLMNLFASHDTHERTKVKNIIHRIYCFITQRRALIRRCMCNIFYEFVFETDKHPGIDEILEILTRIINGFNIPIRPQHVQMLQKALIPLHKPRSLQNYHGNLVTCMTIFASKEPIHSVKVVLELLRYWPHCNPFKQLIFLNELEDVLVHTEPQYFVQFALPLLYRLAKCCDTEHFQVAERCLCLWSSDQFVKLTLDAVDVRPHTFHTMFPVLMKNALSHWHESVRTLSRHLLVVMKNTDEDLFRKIQQQFGNTDAVNEHSV